MVFKLIEAGENPVILDNLSTALRWAVPDSVENRQSFCKSLIVILLYLFICK